MAESGEKRDAKGASVSGAGDDSPHYINNIDRAHLLLALHHISLGQQTDADIVLANYWSLIGFNLFYGMPAPPGYPPAGGGI